MFNKVGGIVPDSYGLSLTVFAQDATSENPVKAGTPLKFATTGPYHAKKAVADDAIVMTAKHTVTSKDAPLGVHVYGYSRNAEFPYSGAIAIGDPVAADGNGGVKKAAAANGSYVYLVNSTKKTVEVLLP